ncbi:MAG: hypothetical protein J5854_02365 [Clostridia bacterium]|nr:hypothetical protein [Clostridia bacterium]
MFQTYDEVLESLPLLLAPADVAAVLGISINYSRELFRKGEAFQTITIGKRRFVTRTHLLDWLSSLEENAQ